MSLLKALKRLLTIPTNSRNSRAKTFSTDNRASWTSLHPPSKPTLSLFAPPEEEEIKRERLLKFSTSSRDGEICIKELRTKSLVKSKECLLLKLLRSWMFPRNPLMITKWSSKVPRSMASILPRIRTWDSVWLENLSERTSQARLTRMILMLISSWLRNHPTDPPLLPTASEMVPKGYTSIDPPLDWMLRNDNNSSNFNLSF